MAVEMLIITTKPWKSDQKIDISASGVHLGVYLHYRSPHFFLKQKGKMPITGTLAVGNLEKSYIYRQEHHVDNGKRREQLTNAQKDQIGRWSGSITCLQDENVLNASSSSVAVPVPVVGDAAMLTRTSKIPKLLPWIQKQWKRMTKMRRRKKKRKKK